MSPFPFYGPYFKGGRVNRILQIDNCVKMPFNVYFRKLGGLRWHRADVSKSCRLNQNHDKRKMALDEIQAAVTEYKADIPELIQIPIQVALNMGESGGLLLALSDDLQNRIGYLSITEKAELLKRIKTDLIF